MKRSGPLLLLCAAVACAVHAQPRDAGLLAHAVERCTRFADLIACGDALNRKRNDPELLVAEADALVAAQRPGEAIGVYRNGVTQGAARGPVEAKIARAESMRRGLLGTCLQQSDAAALRACEAAWLPGAADEVTVFKRRGRLLQGDRQDAAALDAYLAAARLAPRDRAVAHAVLDLAAEGRHDAAMTAAVASAKACLRPAAAVRDAVPVRNARGAATVDSNAAEITRSN